MFNKFLRRAAALLLLAAALAFAPSVFAQTSAPQQPTNDDQKTQGQSSADAQPATETDAPQATPAVEAQSEPEPLFREFKGVTIGMSAEEARARLGNPQEKDKVQDFFAFSDRERARVYYDAEGKVSAVIVTFIGKNNNAPAPASVLGAEVEARPDGSLYHVVQYPKAGYWVAYSRTTGDEPLTIITMQKR